MKIIFENKNIVVIEKDVGLDSEKQVPKELKEQLGGEFFCVHRLDKNVGGVMVYAKNKQSAAMFSRLIAENKMIKEYVATVHGKPEKSGVLEDLLFKDSRKNKVFVVKRERKGVKYAKLEYDVLKENDDTSLVHIKLHTGRSHQIRVQFASRGYSLVGDHKYGARDKVSTPMLYSSKITFPYNDKMQSFELLPTWAE